MYRVTVDYTNFNDEETSDVLYFHLTETELTEMELTQKGGLDGMLQTLIETKDNAKIVKIFKDFILRSYGIRSADGSSFIKVDPEGKRLADRFVQTAAYDAFFMRLAGSVEEQIKFINGILPKKYQTALTSPEAVAMMKNEHPELADKFIETLSK